LDSIRSSSDLIISTTTKDIDSNVNSSPQEPRTTKEAEPPAAEHTSKSFCR
jgi:hypothetical protein